MWSLRKLFFYYQYLRKPRWDTGITPPELTAYAQGHFPGRVLDLGCGTGTNAIYLAKCGWQVSAVDYVKPAVKAAQRKAHLAGVKVNFICEDVTRLHGISEPFDLILDIGCLHSLPRQKREVYYSNLNHLLAKQGTFLLYAFVRPNEEEPVGLTNRDLKLLGDLLELVEKQEGSDQGQRSIWFTWRKKA